MIKTAYSCSTVKLGNDDDDEVLAFKRYSEPKLAGKKQKALDVLTTCLALIQKGIFMVFERFKTSPCRRSESW